MGMLPRNGRYRLLAARLGESCAPSSAATIQRISDRIYSEHVRFLAEVGEVTIFSWLAQRCPDDRQQNQVIQVVGTNYLHTVSNIFSAEELGSQLEEPRWLPGRLLNLFCPIGKNPAGDPLVQVLSGKRAGQVGLLDHETAELVESLSRKHDGDALVEACVREGALAFGDTSQSTANLVTSLLDAYDGALSGPLTPPPPKRELSTSMQARKARRLAAKKKYSLARREYRGRSDAEAEEAIAKARSEFDQELAAIAVEYPVEPS